MAAPKIVIMTILLGAPKPAVIMEKDFARRSPNQTNCLGV